MTQELRLRRPDDWHLHLRDGAALRAVLPFTAARFARAIVMPNLTPPVTTTALALSYRQRILAALPAGAGFQPLMTLYLTDTTNAAEVERAHASGAIFGCKLYPAGASRRLRPCRRSICHCWCTARSLTLGSTYSSARPASSSRYCRH